jgi:hypothetical protein
MLNLLETFISFAVVMLGMSLILTAATQAISGFIGSRGNNLEWALGNLLRNLRPELTAVKEPDGPDLAARLTKHILEHPLISDSAYQGEGLLVVRIGRRVVAFLKRRFKVLVPLVDRIALQWAQTSPLQRRWTRATTVRFEELIRIIDLIADGANPAGPPSGDWTEKETAAWLSGDPRLNREWFDTAMDRASQRFATHMRSVTFVCSVALAFGAHFDALDLYRKLSSDAELRDNVASRAEAMMARYEQSIAAEELRPSDTTREFGGRLRMAKSQADEIRTELGSAGIDLFPSPYATHLRAEGCFNPWRLGPVLALSRFFGVELIPDAPGCHDFLPWIDFRHFVGVLISCVLLSLGAPFWYNQLRMLISLKPVVAQKDEKERQKAAQDEVVTFIEK